MAEILITMHCNEDYKYSNWQNILPPCERQATEDLSSCWVMAVIHMRVAKGFSWPLSFLCPIVQCCPQTVPTPYCWWGQWPLMAGSPPKPLWNIPCLVWEAPTLPLSAPSNPHQVLHHPSWRNQCPHELILWEGFKTPVRNNSVMWGLLIFSR